VPFELIPQKLIYGGDALGHYQGRPVLVPRALPGERLEVEEVRTAKGVVHARPLRVLEASPNRVDPPCLYFGRCGGCQYQHLAPEHQAAAKREILRETLRRIGKITWESEIQIHAAHPWNYRNQAQLKVARRPDGQVALGFFEAESHRLFPVDVCLILSPRLNAILTQLRQGEWSRLLGKCREVELLVDERDERVAVTLRGRLSPAEAEATARDMLSRPSGVVSVAAEMDGKLQVFGEPRLEYAVGDFRYRISPGSFFQASRFLLPELVAAVTGDEAGLPAAVISGRQTLALDLFAGVGLFTLPLARRFTQVAGVEASAPSAADLAANAEAHSLQNVRAVSATAFDFLRRFAQAEPDLVILDPPRAGVGVRTLKLLATLRPRRIHYVSCNPPTLARDLGYLLGRGYRLNSVELFDFFPQTFHLESLVRLTRHDGASE
jgi:23S rRNA (uracil1939-C5)-methyltransferase